MINILFSGVDKKIGFSIQQQKILSKYIVNNKKIVFMASVFDDYEKSQYNFERFIRYFKECNITFSSASLIDGRCDIDMANKLLENSDYLFLMGGSPELQMNSIKEYKLSDNIKSKKIIIGVSAGSMNQSNRVIYKDDFDNYNLKDYEGLNLVDINVFPHFDIDNENILSEAKELSFIIPLTLLPNSSFIVVDDGNIKYYGEHFIISNGKIL